MQNIRPLALQIGIQFGKGGEGRIISELFKYLPLAGVGIIGAVSGPDNVSSLTEGKVVSFFPEDGAKIARLRMTRLTLLRLLREESPDIIASHFALYALPIINKLHTRPFVNHFHGPWGAESAQEGAGIFTSTAKALIEKSVYRRADRVIVLSQAFADVAVTQYGVLPENIRIVPGCVDILRFRLSTTRVQARERLGLPLNRPISLSVRRLVKRMGLLDLLGAMKQIQIKIPDVLLCIAGSGPLREQLEHLTDQHGIRGNVHFLGYVADEDLPYVYQAADINVVPTTALEGFGLVAAEALAAGTPSMVTPVGGLPDVVAGLSSDLVFHSSKQEDLAEGLISALLGSTQLPSSKQCSEYASNHFSSTLMAERTAAIYKDLL